MTSKTAALTLITLVFAFMLSAEEKTGTVRGYVVDSACAFTKNLDKPVSGECALACARAGSPLVILADDGNIERGGSRAIVIEKIAPESARK